jgi:hypothetical protein
VAATEGEEVVVGGAQGEGEHGGGPILQAGVKTSVISVISVMRGGFGLVLKGFGA